MSPRRSDGGRGSRRGADRGGGRSRGGTRGGGGRGGRAPGAGASGRQDREQAGGRSRAKGVGGEQVEGRQAVRELLLAGRRRVRELQVVADGEAGDGLADLVELAVDLGVPVRRVSRAVLARAARTDAPQGVVATAAPLPEHDLDSLLDTRPDGTAPFLLALDGVTDPGNLGAALRSAECAGATGVVLPRHRAVHVTPAATKAAAGAVEHLPMAVVGGLPAALATMGQRGVWVVGLDAGGETTLFDIDLADEPVCLVVGAEGSGLSRLVRQRCDVVAAIPLAGTLSSLNVAVAAALGCYEVLRRRGGAATQRVAPEV